MADGSLPGLLVKTHADLGSLIAKPKLTDTLLSKAPFRFLHDVVSAVTAATGFGSGLFSGAELDAHALKEKQEKMDYLTKIIGAVEKELGGAVSLEVRPSKVVAGLEPENLNIFLQVRMRSCPQPPPVVSPSKDKFSRCLAKMPPHSRRRPPNGTDTRRFPASLDIRGSPMQAKLGVLMVFWRCTRSLPTRQRCIGCNERWRKASWSFSCIADAPIEMPLDSLCVLTNRGARYLSISSVPCFVVPSSTGPLCCF